MTKQKLKAIARSLIGGLLVLLCWNDLSRAYAEKKPFLLVFLDEEQGEANPSADESPSPPPVVAPKPRGPYRDGTYRAASETPWGTMAIQVTVQNGNWTAVTPTSVPPSPPSRYAAPRLAQQALAAQGANIVGVSGATYTSDAFRKDLRTIVSQSKV